MTPETCDKCPASSVFTTGNFETKECGLKRLRVCTTYNSVACCTMLFRSNAIYLEKADGVTGINVVVIVVGEVPNGAFVLLFPFASETRQARPRQQ